MIHPYSDYLLHDVGTGDRIPVLPSAELLSIANQIAPRRCGRSAPATA
jgi:hypothetical protein